MPENRKPSLVSDPSNSHRSYSMRWKHETLLRDGYVVVPTLVLRNYARLKPYPLTLSEAMFVIHLMEFKWDSKHPYPSYKKLAERMGVSDKRVRRLAQSLEQKSYLVRRARVATTNEFDLDPLFDALNKSIDSDATLSDAKIA